MLTSYPNPNLYTLPYRIQDVGARWQYENISIFKPVIRVIHERLYFLIKTYRFISITLVEDDPGTEVGSLISAKRKIFAI